MAEPFYDEDLAWIHDLCCSSFVEQAGSWILDAMGRAGIRGGRVVDLGCGTGVWAGRLADHGFDVTGIDCSAAMLRIARNRVPEASFLSASFYDTPLPAAVTVTSIGECLNYAEDPAGHAGRVRRLARTVWEALEPGGIFFLDTRQPGENREAAPHDCTEGADWMVLSSSRHGEGRRSLRRRIVTMRRVEGRWRKSVERHTLALFGAAELAGWLREIGFRVRIRRGYGDFCPAPDMRVLTARKPA